MTALVKTEQYPFSAFVGGRDVKEALLLALINPRIGGVLVDGAHGTGKSVLIRSIRNLTKLTFHELPAGTSEEMLGGTVNIEKTIREGRTVYDEGLLARANGGILYADDAALLPDVVTERLIHTLSTKEYDSHDRKEPARCSFLFLASADIREMPLRPGLLDHFGLYAAAENITVQPEFSENDTLENKENPLPDTKMLQRRNQVLKARMEIMRRCEAFRRDPDAFSEQYEPQQEALRRHIEESRERLENIHLTESILNKIVEKTLAACVSGHRADLVMEETVKAVAAFRGRTEVLEEDVDEAAYFVLPHRLRTAVSPDTAPPEPQEEVQPQEEDEPDRPEEPDNDSGNDPDGDEEMPDQDTDTQDSDAGNSYYKDIPKVFGIGQTFEVIAFSHKEDRAYRNGSGKRTRTRTEAKSGRYLYPTERRRNNDIAFDATIRAAAPYQRIREHPDTAISIREEDIREKVRQKRISNLLVFVVDASGSMGAARRMSEAKGAVLSLLKDAYVKRDQVAMVTFGGDGAQVVLPPTRSAERGYRMLADLKTGGKTPLNAGLAKGLQIIWNEHRLKPDQMPLLIVITDGKGNLPAQPGKKPKEELMEIAERIAKIHSIETMVIDTERRGMMSFGIAARLAGILGARYYRLDDLKDGELGELVRDGIAGRNR